MPESRDGQFYKTYIPCSVDEKAKMRLTVLA